MASEQHFCPNCGAELNGNPKFCPTCGYQLVTDEGQSTEQSTTDATESRTQRTKTTGHQPAGAPQPPKKNGKKSHKPALIVLGCVVAVIVIIGGFLIGKTMTNTSVETDQSSSEQSAKVSSRESSSSSSASSTATTQSSTSTNDNQLVRATMSPREMAAAFAVYADRTSIWPAISSDGMAGQLDVQIVTNDLDLANPGEKDVRYDVSAGTNGSDPMLSYTLLNGKIYFYTIYGDEDMTISPSNETTVSQIVEYLNSENEAQQVENLSKKVVLSDER